MTDLLPCPFCGGEVRIVLFKNEFDCYWWAVARGADDETACHCRVFMECDSRWQVNEGDEPEDYPLASALKRWLIEKWNTRTPEQAIAATRGAHSKAQSKTEPMLSEQSESLSDATLGSGTLTAEQIMSIAGKHQPDYCSDTHVCFDWQAIADELNATLGSGKCEMRESSEYVECNVQTFTCSACGWHGAIDDLFASDAIPNFCPNCGKAVKR